jgi:RimJ/RimL family protein N-acetyltransferase
MSVRLNEFAQAIGDAVPGWSARSLPPRKALEGRFCTLEPLDADRHAADLYDAYSAANDDRDWTYLANNRFTDLDSYFAYAQKSAAGADPMHFAVIDRQSARAIGTLSLMRMDPDNGVIEVGWVTYSPVLKQTTASTEAQFLFMQLVFDELGYRRYEWKCDNFNEPSKRTATRLGFRFEGIFRQAVVYKGRSRDTAWFSIIDSEWPTVKAGFQAWLLPANFDDQGRQRATLELLRCGGRVKA